MEKQEIQQIQIEEQEIDLLEVFYVLWRKAWVLALALLFGAAGAGLVTFFFITPQYEATSIIYILSKTTSITSLADLQIGSQMAADFQIIATTREVVEVVMDATTPEPVTDFAQVDEVERRAREAARAAVAKLCH